MKFIKFNVVLSVLFAIFATFAAVHEVEHIKYNDGSSCMICVVKNNMASDDVIEPFFEVQPFHFDKIAQTKEVFYLNAKPNQNQNRDPPHIS